MAKKSKLLAALDAHKGRDYQAEKRKAQVKAAEKRKRQKLDTPQQAENEDDTIENNDQASHTAEETHQPVEPTEKDDFADFDEDENAAVDDKASTTIPQSVQSTDAAASASEAEDESDVPVSDLGDSDLEDAIPYQKMTINNGPALVASRTRIAVVKNPKTTPFHHHNSLISSLEPATESIPDPNDDLTRELEFYRIARTAVLSARDLLESEGIPFSRPADYFAEMVKTDEHMGRVKQKMYDEAAGKKAAEEARKLRDARKFGKAVQVAKEQERAKEKKTTLDRIKELKRKRRGADTGKVAEGNVDDDLFQTVDVEKAGAKDRSGRERGPGFNAKRQKRDQKYGFGGKKRHSKSGDVASSSDMRGFSAARMKGKGGKVKAKRPGKSRRSATR
ncbi:putative rRNA-processing protein ebp2 [Cladophialophora carrionii]|uniref:Putative rRNA-processing protein ebp2 n=1 Tax=Cladophialophora carrionii TaxID=86049 RepID=A0A1C1C8T1_9EURO|nr:putative rRNA-processing protein ebp2 [Cladophialophora carrionii]